MKIELYVSPSGNDNHEGSKELPFRTIERAQADVRVNNKETDIVVYLREGEYRRAAPMRFNENDSGRSGCTVTYSAYPGENVVISGGIPITGWVRAEDELGRNLWSSSLPDVAYTRHLYRNGRALLRPRSTVRESHGWDKIQDETCSFWNPVERVITYDGELTVHEGYRTTNPEMATWRNPSDIEAVVDIGWTHNICPVDSIERDGNGAILRMRMPVFRDCQIKNGCQIGSPSYFENVFELMDEPGEWYFDRSSRTVYYFAEEGEDPNGSSFIIPLAEQLLIIKGSMERRVENLAFRDLSFSYTTWLRPSEFGHAEIQANTVKDPDDDLIQHLKYIKPESSLSLEWTSNIVFTGNRFTRLGSSAVDIGTGCRSTLIEGNVFEDLAGSGVQIGSFHMMDSHPEIDEEIVSGNAVKNNVFRRIGTEYKGSIAIMAGFTEGTVIAHNEISHCSYSGISVGWGWAYSEPGSETRYVDPTGPDYPRFTTPSVMKNNVIEYNHIHHVLLDLHDGGAIYTLSQQPNSVIRGNYIHDNGDASNPYPGEVLVHKSADPEDRVRHKPYTSAKGFPGGIYMDEGTGGYEVTANIVHDVPIPVFYHKVLDNRFETNQVHGNWYNLRPNEQGFPNEAAEAAGLQKEFRGLL